MSGTIFQLWRGLNSALPRAKPSSGLQFERPEVAFERIRGRRCQLRWRLLLSDCDIMLQQSMLQLLLIVGYTLHTTWLRWFNVPSSRPGAPWHIQATVYSGKARGATACCWVARAVCETRSAAAIVATGASSFSCCASHLAILGY